MEPVQVVGKHPRGRMQISCWGDKSLGHRETGLVWGHHLIKVVTESERMNEILESERGEKFSQGDSCRMQLMDRRKEEEAVKGTDDMTENLKKWDSRTESWI